MMKLLSMLWVFAGFSLIAAQPELPEFCWKDSYGRGVGTIPSQCDEDKDKIGLLCYSKCPSGMYRWGFDCHAYCPQGFRDEGLFCRKDAYGRGAGYAFWHWDLCESQHGKGNCEWFWGMIYPKCADGFHNSACCICSPNDIDCNSLPWMSEVLDFASCAKQIRIGDPTPMKCLPAQENSGGLCYTPCDTGYYGVGPVCWGAAPDGMVDCGMGAAEDSAKCAEIITGQIMSTFEFALFVASAGTSGVAKAGTSLGRASSFAELIKDVSKLMDVYGTVQLPSDVAGIVESAATYNYNSLKEEDIARMSAEILAIFDPTGVSSIVASFTYATCSEYFN